jgi:serine/threonine protein kinase/tetratricopeptide (TPR) repeat protein
MRSSIPPRPPLPANAPLLGARYVLLDEIGRGAMGVVHRAVDRLGGDVVTVKLALGAGDDAVAPTHPRDPLKTVSPADTWTGSGWYDARRNVDTTHARSHLPDDVLMSLAHEFAVLASLRHPNVIRVFDYGFDRRRGPYLVMEHRPDASTLLLAAEGAPRARKLGLLIELLRGLAYLHRRGIVHRDVKPENVLVDGGHAKIVDFGVSIPVEQRAYDLAGTGPYLAPELLEAGAPSVQSDLWAVGVVATELLTGRHPFAGGDLFAAMLFGEPDLEGLDEAVAPVVARLLARAPEARYASALEAAEALAGTLPEHPPFETVETRESFLQASRLVGRGAELDSLTKALAPLPEGRGSVWLLGGESGVGKSRLADETAIRALVGGARVLRGQAVADAASPYDVWRPVLRGLALTAAPTDGEAAILRVVLPDIDALVGRPVASPAVGDEAAAQTQLLVTIEEIITRERTPTLIVLEDLQWAGSESLRLLAWLSRAVPRAPVMILGTYRDDEAPRLPAMIADARMLKLGRLTREAVGELSLAIIGPSAADEHLVDRLVTETEGNPFFLVETLRAIAGEVGRLEALGAHHIRPDVPAEGVRRVLDRRLSRTSPETRGVLQLAAVAGRRLDVAVLERASGAADLEAHLRSAADLAIVEAKGDAWEFAHDQLREALQREVEASVRAAHHGRIAGAIEAVHGEHEDKLAALAHHWELARDEPRSMRYAELAGARALEVGAFPEAVILLDRARAYAEPRADRSPPALLFRIDAQLALAHYQLGDLVRARRAGELALAHVGDPIPEGPLGKVLATAREAAVRLGQSLRPSRETRLPPADLARYARVLIVLSECFVFGMESQSFVIAALRLTNRTAPAGPSAALARGWLDLGMLAMTTPWKRTAQRWVDRALVMSRAHGAENDHAFAVSRAGVLAITTARWEEAERLIHAAEDAATNRGDRRLLDECLLLIAAVRFFQGRHAEARDQYARALAAARRSGTHQVARWSALGCADVDLRGGRHGEAIEAYDRAVAGGEMPATERVWVHGMRALARLRSGDREGARADALASLSLLDRSLAVAYWIQHGVHATSRVLLALSPPGRPSAEARRSVMHASLLGSVVGFARASASLLQGELLLRMGRPGLARRALLRGKRVAVDLDLAYEAAMADLALASSADPKDRAPLVQRAHEGLRAIGAHDDALAAGEALRDQPAGFERARW